VTDQPEQDAPPAYAAIALETPTEGMAGAYPAGPPEAGRVYGLLCVGTEPREGGGLLAGYALVPLPIQIRRPGELVVPPGKVLVK
jgi:hypothetical protein